MNDDELKKLFDSLDEAPKKNDSEGDVKTPSKDSSKAMNDSQKDKTDKTKVSNSEKPSSKTESKTQEDKLAKSKKSESVTEEKVTAKPEVRPAKIEVKESKEKSTKTPEKKKTAPSKVEEKKPVSVKVEEKKSNPTNEERKTFPAKKDESNVKAEKTTDVKPVTTKPAFDVDAIERKVKAWYIRVTSERKEKEEAEEKLPWREREYLKNFPLSFKGVLGVLLVITIIVAVMCFLFMPQFRVLKFVVEGNITISEQELIELSGIELNSHLFSNISGNPIDIVKLNYGRIEKQMKDHNPYIKDIEISASFPSTIKISVTERNKIAYVKMPDGYAAIDEDGTVIELTTIIKDDASHAVICGLDVSGAVVDKPIEIKNDSDYQKAIIVLGAILTSDISGGNSDEYMMFENTKEIRIIPGGNIFLTIVLPSGSELQVKLKDIVNINDDMAILRRAIIVDTFDGLPDGSFDMTGDEYVYRKYD